MGQAAEKDRPAGEDVAWLNEDGAWTATLGAAVLRTAYQPIFRFSGDRLVPVAAEALVRPLIGGRPASPPRLFRGLSTRDLVAVESVLRRLHLRNGANLPAGARRIFVNIHPEAIVSRHGLERSLDEMGAELAIAGLSPRSVICEITEQREASRELLLHAVWAMRARGFLVAIDDFGSAFADPDRVRTLVPDIVKIDGASVRSMMKTPDGLSILHRTVAGFSASGIRTVLEGIETLRHVELARLCGPVLLQGFGLARPRLAPLGRAPWTATAMPVGDETMRKRMA